MTEKQPTARKNSFQFGLIDFRVEEDPAANQSLFPIYIALLAGRATVSVSIQQLSFGEQVNDERTSV